MTVINCGFSDNLQLLHCCSLKQPECDQEIVETINKIDDNFIFQMLLDIDEICGRNVCSNVPISNWGCDTGG